MHGKLCFALILSLVALFATRCSGGSIDVPKPAGDDSQLIAEKATGFSRVLWGIWNIEIDLDTKAATVSQARKLEAHFNITDMILPPACEDCLKITVNSFNKTTRILDTSITLKNSFQISGRDVRGILFTNEAGHELRNADDWTGLWDITGGDTINPFIAFAKDQPTRVFDIGAQHTEKFLVYIPIPPQYNVIKFAADASWPGNCKEPYTIRDFEQLTPLYNVAGSQANLSVFVSDWQNDVSKVTLIAPEITGEGSTDFTYVDGDLWTLVLNNTKGAGGGDYKLKIVATSVNAPTISLYDFCTIHITELAPTNPVDVTPPWLNFSPKGIEATDKYIYIAGGINGLHIFDTVDLEAPAWLNKVDLNNNPVDIAIDGNYACAAGSKYGMHIIDISNPQSLVMAGYVATPGQCYKVAADNGYAYVADLSFGLHIIDIVPPESAHIVKTVEIGGSPLGVSVKDGYAYVAAASSGLKIVDIDPPASAAVIKTVDTPGTAVDVVEQSGYAYICLGPGGFSIVDVTPPDSASIINTVSTSNAISVATEGGTACVADSISGLHIIDISVPGSEKILKTVPCTGTLRGLSIIKGYVYLIDIVSGLKIFDIEPVQDAALVNRLITPSRTGYVAAEPGLVYITAKEGGLMVADTASPPSAYFKTAVDTTGATGIAVSNGYAYVADSTGGFRAIDVDPLETAAVVKTITTGATFYDACVGGTLAYAVSSTSFYAVNITPPEDASVKKTVPITGDSTSIDVEGKYAYVVNGTQGLIIINLEPPGSEGIVNKVSVLGTPSAGDADDGYAYVVTSTGLHIVDVDPVGSASVVKSVPTPDYAMDIVVAKGYAYIAGAGAGLQIIDINPVESAHIISSVPTPDNAIGVAVQDNYAYVSDSQGGLRIIQLW